MKLARYLLDTDTFSYLISGKHPSVRKHVLAEQQAISLSAITLAEALFGARKCGSTKLEGIIGLFREMFPVVPWDPAAAVAYAGIRAELERNGKPIGEMDMLIAAAAMSGDYTLVTNNERHFGRIKGLKIENWVIGREYG